MTAQPLQFPSRCITQGCDGYAGEFKMFCSRCSEEISALGAYRAKQIRRETWWWLWRRRTWRKFRRVLARVEFAAFLAVSVAGMGLAFYAVWLLVRAWR